MEFVKSPTPRHSGESNESPAPAGYMHPHPLDALQIATFRYTKDKSTRERISLYEDVFFFDLEDTLYLANEAKIAKLDHLYHFCRNTMNMNNDEEIRRMMTDKMNVIIETMAAHNTPIDDPYQFLTPNKELGKLLGSMKARLWIMTNSKLEHAKKVLKKLNLSQYFEGIVYKPEGTYLGKSQKTFYDVAMLAADVNDPIHCYFIDDSIYNVFMANNCGWHAVLHYNKHMHNPPPAIYAEYEKLIHKATSLFQLKTIYPNLFKD